MTRAEASEGRLDELTDAEIERIEGSVFCCGGPPKALPQPLVNKACRGRDDRAVKRAD